MTTPTTTQRPDSSLARDLFAAARYYLGRPRVLLILATIMIVTGLVFNWSWLVAAGVAPILISVLPCLIMCAVGACMICRSGEKQSVPVGDAAEAAGQPPARAVSATGKPLVATNSIEAAVPVSPESNPPGGGADCCRDVMNEDKPEQPIDLKPNQERRDPYA